MCCVFAGCVAKTVSPGGASPSPIPIPLPETQVPITQKITVGITTQPTATYDYDRENDRKFIAESSATLLMVGSTLNIFGDYMIAADGPGIVRCGKNARLPVDNAVYKLENMPVSYRLTEAKADMVSGMRDIYDGLEYSTDVGGYLQFNDQKNLKESSDISTSYFNSGFAKVQKSTNTMRSIYPEY